MVPDLRGFQNAQQHQIYDDVFSSHIHTIHIYIICIFIYLYFFCCQDVFHTVRVKTALSSGATNMHRIFWEMRNSKYLKPVEDNGDMFPCADRERGHHWKHLASVDHGNVGSQSYTEDDCNYETQKDMAFYSKNFHFKTAKLGICDPNKLCNQKKTGKKRKRTAEPPCPMRPGGPDAIKKEAASTLLLRHMAKTDFERHGHQWVSCLFMPGHLYQHKASGKFMISFSCEGAMCMGIEVKTIDLHDTKWVAFSWKELRIVEMLMLNLHVPEYEAWPTQRVHPQCVPLDLRHYGFMLMVTGDAEWVLPYALRHGFPRLQKNLHNICDEYQLDPMLGDSENVGKTEYARALIWKFFPKESLGTKEYYVQQWASWKQHRPRSTVQDKRLLLACVESMDADEREFFKLERELAEVATFRRAGGARASWENWTPEPLKQLIPNGAMEASKFVFLGRHPKSHKPHAIKLTYIYLCVYIYIYISCVGGWWLVGFVFLVRFVSIVRACQQSSVRLRVDVASEAGNILTKCAPAGRGVACGVGRALPLVGFSAATIFWFPV